MTLGATDDARLREDAFELLVDGESYDAWKTVLFERRLDTITARFSVAAQPIPGVAWPLPTGTRVEARVASERLLTGHVFAVDGQLADRVLSAHGRDLTADLVDSSTTVEPSEFKGLTLAQLASRLVEPFSLELVNLVGAGEPFEVFRIQQGETAFAALERAARLRGVLVTADGFGRIVLERPSTGPDAAPREALVEGENIRDAALRDDTQGRFSRYVVKGQRSGSDFAAGGDVRAIEGIAFDGSFSPDRFRPLVIIAEGQVTFSSAEDRARWEATVRAARSQTLDVVVESWRRRGVGELWRVNELVDVVIPTWQIDSTMLVAGVRFERGAQTGEQTTRSVVRRGAFVTQPRVDEDNPFQNLRAGELVDELDRER